MRHIVTQTLSIGLTLSVLTILPACTWLQPYKIDIQQGTPITASQVERLAIGMNQQQVKYLIGSPSIVDPLNPLMWHYTYQFKAGTDARRAGIRNAKNQNLRLEFNDQGTLVHIEGGKNLPAAYPTLPVSKISR